MRQHAYAYAAIDAALFPLTIFSTRCLRYYANAMLAATIFAAEPDGDMADTVR